MKASFKLVSFLLRPWAMNCSEYIEISSAPLGAELLFTPVAARQGVALFVGLCADVVLDCPYEEV